MTRRFCNQWFLAVAIFLAANFSSRADLTGALPVLAKSTVLEKDVTYLRVGEVGTNLAEEIQSAQNALAATNKIAGTVLDLRFADGDDLASASAVENFFAPKKLPLAILVNDETRGAAAKLAADLREANDGLIFGESEAVKPDIAIKENPADERAFLKNPFGTLAQIETNPIPATNTLFSFVDHTTEADLVRAKIKDGEQDESSSEIPNSELKMPFIRDPVLARAVDLIKGLAIVRQSRL